MEQQVLLEPEKTAVLIIDMQNDFVHREGASLRYFRSHSGGRIMAGAGQPTAAEQIVPCLIELVAAARDAGAPLMWVRTINDENTTSPKALAQGKRFVWADDEWGTAFFAGLGPASGEPVVSKHRHSAFFGTDLDIILRRSSINTLLITGVSTPYCVEGTARDAFARDYRVFTLSDATASKVQSEHEAALARLDRVFGEVWSTAGVIAAWRTAVQS